MKLAILGGTFDPPHIGHLFLADICLVELGYTKVLFVPAHIPAHKEIESGTGPKERLEMLRLETEGRDGFDLSDMEIQRGGISYSIDTVREVKTKYPEMKGNPGLLIGDDLLSDFHEWKEYSNLCREADIIVARREPSRADTVNFRHTYLENPVLPVSSSAVRERRKKNMAFRYLVTEKIYSYIMEKQLYVH